MRRSLLLLSPSAPGAFPKLLSPLSVGHVTLRNRSVFGSIHSGMEDKEKDFPELAVYMRERAAGGVGLIITGGISPNIAGWVAPFSGRLSMGHHVERHKQVTKAVHEEGGLIAMQILHSGRYGYHPFVVAPSRLKSPISPFTPRGLTNFGVKKQIRDFANCARLAQEAGYDGVEIMGSEGYLISEFMSPKTNKRTDDWGGSFENRIRFGVEIVRKVREAVGKDFLIIYRLSLLDLVENGSTWDEVIRKDVSHVVLFLENGSQDRIELCVIAKYYSSRCYTWQNKWKKLEPQ